MEQNKKNIDEMTNIEGQQNQAKSGTKKIRQKENILDGWIFFACHGVFCDGDTDFAQGHQD